MSPDESMNTPSSGNNSKVWIVTDTGHDYSAAHKYGQPDVLLPFGTYSPMAVDGIARELSRSIGSLVNSSEDYLLLSGLPVACSLALWLWLRKFKKCNLLLWNPSPRVKAYKVQTIDAEHLDGQLDKAITGAMT